jgi:hypothetical protein
MCCLVRRQMFCRPITLNSAYYKRSWLIRIKYLIFSHLLRSLLVAPDNLNIQGYFLSRPAPANVLSIGVSSG